MNTKEYKMGLTQIKGVGILRDFLNKHEHLRTGGIQRSLTNFNKFRCLSGIDELLGECSLKDGINIFSGEFVLPIHDYTGYLGSVRIYGENVVKWEYTEIIEEIFIIKDVELE